MIIDLTVDMQRFLPPVSPTKLKMLEPWKDMADDIIEIPDGAGLSDTTRNDLVELWTSGDDSGFHSPYTLVTLPFAYPQIHISPESALYFLSSALHVVSLAAY